MPHIEPHGGLRRAILMVATLVTGLSLLIGFTALPNGHTMVASAAGISIVDD